MAQVVPAMPALVSVSASSFDRAGTAHRHMRLAISISRMMRGPSGFACGAAATLADVGLARQRLARGSARGPSQPEVLVWLEPITGK